MFEEERDYYKYLCILADYEEECHFELFAFCLMSNHIHLLIHVNDISLSSVFRHVSTRYSMWFNMKYNRSGFLQDGRFYSEPVESVRYLLTAARYIHRNPLKAGLESRIGSDYKWSSFHAYANSRVKCPGLLYQIVDTEKIPEICGGLKYFLEYHNAEAAEEDSCLDVERFKRRIPDDVAISIMKDMCGCETVADFQNLSVADRNKNICILKQSHISVRQLSRITGVPKGVIERVLKHSSNYETGNAAEKKKP